MSVAKGAAPQLFPAEEVTVTRQCLSLWFGAGWGLRLLTHAGLFFASKASARLFWQGPETQRGQDERFKKWR